MNKLDDILDRAQWDDIEDSGTKQRIKDLFQELIGKDVEKLRFTTHDAADVAMVERENFFIDGKNAEKRRLRKLVDSL